MRRSAAPVFTAEHLMMIRVRCILASVAISVFLLLIGFSTAAWSPAPLVDGWPVYHRLMTWMNGEIGLWPYLMGPHGSHPHSIVYGLYLIDLFFGARQIVPHLASVASIAAMAVLMALWVRSAVSQRCGAPLGDIAASAVLLIVVTTSSELLAPFQVVLTGSRLAYGMFFFLFVIILRRDARVADIILLAVSCALVTFHGSGLMFGVVVLVQHLLLARSWTQRILGAAPVIAFVVYTRMWLPPGAGEMAGVSQWIQQINLQSVINLLAASSAFYGVPLVPLFTDPAYRWICVAGGMLVAVVTTLWALYVFVRFKRETSVTLGLALLSLFVALSALSAALVWESRRVIGVANDPLLAVLFTQRYAGAALLAYGIAVVPLLGAGPRFVKAGLVAVALLVAPLLASNVWTLRERAGITDALNQSATSLLVGAQITDPPGEFLWPAVSEDWFWPKALTATVAFMNERRIGYAYGLPKMGSRSVDLWRAPLSSLRVQATTIATVCSVVGQIPAFERRDLLRRPHFLAVADASGVIVGAVAVPTGAWAHAVTGYVRCENGPEVQGLQVLIGSLHVQ